MKTWTMGLVAFLFLATSASAQERRDDREQEQRQNERSQQGVRNQQGARPNAPVGHGYIPSRGPQPVTRGTPTVQHNGSPQSARTVERRSYRDQARHPETPHVHPQGDQWVGHDSGRSDARYHLDRPWAHGRFTGGFGAHYVYRIRGGTPERFSLDGQWFAVAPADYELCRDWDWSNDDIVLYADPDHDGFYLAYDTRLGTYAHVEYLGG